MLSLLFGGEKIKERMDGHFKQPPEMDFSHEDNLSEKLKRWKQTMNLYLEVAMGETQKRNSA